MRRRHIGSRSPSASPAGFRLLLAGLCSLVLPLDGADGALKVNAGIGNAHASRGGGNSNEYASVGGVESPMLMGQQQTKSDRSAMNPAGKARNGDDLVSQVDIILIRGATVYTPEFQGTQDVLFSGEKILAIKTSIPQEHVLGLGGVVVDAHGMIVVPGFVDIHSHISGGGGELGERSRTPEAALSAIIEAGITSVAGILGTDGTGRSLEGLMAKANALEEEGLSTYTWSGSYRCCPPLTVTGDVVRDLQLLKKVVGIGEIAISDHRSSWPSSDDLAALAANVRVAGMLSGKKGVLHLHVGTGSSGLDPLHAAINATGGALPIDHFLPTHCSSRGPALLSQAWEWVTKHGGNVDFTADSLTAHRNDTIDTLVQWAAADDARHRRHQSYSGRIDGDDDGDDNDDKRPNDCQASQTRPVMGGVSVSTDAFGSFPEFDEEGKLTSYRVSSPDSLLHMIRALVLDHSWKLEKVRTRKRIPISQDIIASALCHQHIRKGIFE